MKKIVEKAHFETNTHFTYIVLPFKNQIQNTPEITGTVCQPCNYALKNLSWSIFSQNTISFTVIRVTARW